MPRFTASRRPGVIVWKSVPEIEMPKLVQSSERFEEMLPNTGSGQPQQRVLIVEDNPFIRTILSLHLARMGHIVVAQADNGATGVQLAEAYQPTLMLLDLDLPQQEGLTVLRQLRATRANMPVIVVSALPAEVYAPRCLRLGAQGYLEKNADASALSREIEQVTQGRTALSASAEELELPWADLSDQDLIALRCLARGGTDRNIAAALAISCLAAQRLCHRLLEDLGIPSLDELRQFSRHLRLG